MKLELKHIVGYLPYQTNFICTRNRISVLDTYIGICAGKNIVDIGYVINNNLKPILRPLSDLTKEIEVNSEKFVPILVIAKMFGFGDLEKFELDDDVVEYGWVERYMDDSQPYSFGYFQNGEFGTWYDDIDDSHPIQVHCKMEVIEWMHEHHFDIHKLIENNLAINISTL